LELKRASSRVPLARLLAFKFVKVEPSVSLTQAVPLYLKKLPPAKVVKVTSLSPERAVAPPPPAVCQVAFPLASLVRTLLALPPAVIWGVEVVILVPTFKFSAMPRSPTTVKAPVAEEVELVVAVIEIFSLKLIKFG